MRTGYRPALELLTEPVWSPFHRREWLTTPRQVAALETIVAAGGRLEGTQRELAERLGYAGPGALNHALGSLRAGGLLAVRTTLGRYGRTILELRPGVSIVRRVAAIVAGVRSTLARMAQRGEYWRPPTRPLEPKRAEIKSEALDTRRRLVAAIPRRYVDELLEGHEHADDEELARCDRCVNIVRDVWARS